MPYFYKGKIMVQMVNFMVIFIITIRVKFYNPSIHNAGAKYICAFHHLFNTQFTLPYFSFNFKHTEPIQILTVYGITECLTLLCYNTCGGGESVTSSCKKGKPIPVTGRGGL